MEPHTHPSVELPIEFCIFLALLVENLEAIFIFVDVFVDYAGKRGGLSGLLSGSTAFRIASH